jgi:ABC-type multidrug transport system fused ATPase/permease subunit
MKALFKIISLVFHPLFMPVYLLLVLFQFPLLLIQSLNPAMRTLIIGLILANNVLVPVVAFKLMKGQGNIQSMQMHTAKERRIPYLLMFVMYAVTVWMFSRTSFVPRIIVLLPLSAAMGSLALYLFNLRFKVSAHTAAFGSAFAYLLLCNFYFAYSVLFWLGLVLLAGGFTATARLYLNAHNEKEIYTGFGIGLFSTLLPGIYYLF